MKTLKESGIQKTIYLSEEVLNKINADVTRQRLGRKVNDARVNHSRVIEDALRSHYDLPPLSIEA